MTEESKQKLRDAGRQDLIDIDEINKSGYAGILPDGGIVDRRKHPEAIPVQENSLFGIPKALPVPPEYILPNSNPPDLDDDDDDFQPCDNCDLPDACADFGCAIKSGIKKSFDGI